MNPPVHLLLFSLADLLVITRDHRCRCSLRPFISFVHRVKAPRFRGMKYASVALIIMRLDNTPFLSLSLSRSSVLQRQFTIARSSIVFSIESKMNSRFFGGIFWEMETSLTDITIFGYTIFWTDWKNEFT